MGSLDVARPPKFLNLLRDGSRQNAEGGLQWANYLPGYMDERAFICENAVYIVVQYGNSTRFRVEFKYYGSPQAPV